MAGAFLAAFLAAPPAAPAYESAAGDGTHSATSLGPRAAFYRPNDADHGVWTSGAQLRLHTAPAYVLEGSVDFAQYSSRGTKVKSTPLQITFIGYFAPETVVSPYLLIGVGWYLNRADAPLADARPRFGPHAGTGIEWLLGGNWSLDGSYRYLWTQIIRLPEAKHILGRDFRDRGHMFTVALNYRL